MYTCESTSRQAIYMKLGDSIFLSSIFFSIIIIFIFTKDRWNWKKIVIRCLTLLFIISFIVALSYYIVLKIGNTPKVQKGFWGISLDMDQEDIRFFKGNPTKIDNEQWYYKIDSKVYSIIYFGDKCTVESNGQYIEICLQGMGHHSHYADIIQKFGEPSNISKSKYGLSKLLFYRKYNLSFGLSEGKVYSWGISKESLEYSDQYFQYLL